MRARGCSAGVALNGAANHNATTRNARPNAPVCGNRRMIGLEPPKNGCDFETRKAMVCATQARKDRDGESSGPAPGKSYAAVSLGKESTASCSLSYTSKTVTSFVTCSK